MNLTKIEDDLIHFLLYFDVFSYPLTREELISYCGVESEQYSSFDMALQSLSESGLISSHLGFYYIGSQQHIIDRRIKGNRKAEARMWTARRYARIISCFPFIRGVFLSGSISKGYMDTRDDIDYFIVTAPGRLWLARTLLTLFKKTILFNSYRNFCINYFVDTGKLTVNERNRFTATEIAFLLPVYGSGVYESLLQKNDWIRAYYPVFKQNRSLIRDHTPWLKTWLEKLMDYAFAARLELGLYRQSERFIRKKYSDMDKDFFDRCFCLKPDELRYLPGCQQSRIMNRYSAKVRLFERRAGLSISPPQEKIMAV